MYGLLGCSNYTFYNLQFTLFKHRQYETLLPQETKKKEKRDSPITDFVWNAQLIEKPNTITVPNFPTVWIYDRLFIPFTASSCCETEYLWFFSKRRAASLVNWQFYCGSCCILYKPHRNCVTFYNLICSESTLWKQFCKTSSTLVFKYFPFSKEKAPKELTNLLALHIYKYP